MKKNIFFITTTFPSQVNLFFLDRITYFIEQGYNVQVFASAGKKEQKLHEDYLKFNLAELTHYYKPEKSGYFNSIIGLLKDLIGKTIETINLLAKTSSKEYFEKFSLSNYFRIKTFSKTITPDVIYVYNGATANNMLFLKALYPDSKFLAHFVGGDFSSRVRKNGVDYYSKLFKKADYLLALSNYSSNVLSALGCSENKIIVNRAGVDTSIFRPSVIGKEKSDVVKFVSVSRIIEKKAHINTIKAFNRISKSNLNFEYHILGDGNEELIRKIKFEIELNPDLKERIYFHGFVTKNNMPKIMRDMDVFIMPSVTTMRWAEQEDTPLSVLEAQAQGIPVISTYHAGIPEIVKIGKTGLLVPERNIKELEKAILFFIENRVALESYKVNCVNFINKEFSNDKRLLEFEDFLQTC
ncbi:glycosyltransferase [Flavobacteriaceae bacterium]|nr:glycosyltransferase [Flavobacteriaceae bacterium]